VNRERWQRVEVLFHRAVDLEPSTRAAFLDVECGGDSDLRIAIERLVEDDQAPAPVLDGPGAIPASAAADPMVGRVVGRYRLTGILGAGGMGVVYAAERADGLFEREVAIKLVRAALGAPDLVRRFEQERRALAALNHPHIGRLYDGGTTEEGSPFLVMERVHGAPIDHWCDDRRLPVAARLALFAEVARTVHFAHTNLVVHRDLKPSNVLVDDSGSPKLLDFGIARLLDQEPSGTTRAATNLMTPEFASPEQLAGAPVTTATDVYSLGVVLYVLLTGRRPYHCTSQSPAAWERMVALRAPTRPSTAVARKSDAPEHPEAPRPLDPDEIAARFDTTPARLRRRLSGDLDRIVMMALRKEPERRYASAQELAEDIERHLAGFPVRAREDSIGYRVARFAQRNRVVVAAVTLVLIALVTGSIAALRGERRARAEAATAAEQVVHTRIEAESFRGIAAFLEDHLLVQLEAVATDDAERLRYAGAMITRQVDQVRRQYPGQAHLGANMIDALGRVALRLGLIEQARELIDEALAAREAEFGAASLEVALSLESRGALLYEAGEYAAAEPVLRRRLALHRTLEIGTHTNVPAAENDLAAVLRNLGQLDEAESLHRDALARRRADGPRSLPVAESLNNLAGIALDRGRPAEAVELLTESLEIRRAILGPAHALAAQTLSNLAGACYHTGDHAQGRRRFEEAEAELRALGRPGEQDLAYVLSSLSGIDMAEGDLGSAEARLGEALEIRSARLPAGHPALIRSLERRAELLDQLERFDESDAAWEDVLCARRETLGPEHPELARTLRKHAVFLVRVNRLEQARDEFAESIAIGRAAGIPNPAELGRAEVGLGRVLGLLDRRAEGLDHARVGMELLRGAADALPEELELGAQTLADLERGG
jgi:serine/threonine-protein kinase